MDCWPTIIVLSSVLDGAAISHELRKRGFIVSFCNSYRDSSSLAASEQLKSTTCLALSMSKKLIIKLALQEDIEVKPLSQYEVVQKTKLANAAIAIIQRTGSLGYISVWLAHDKPLLDSIDLINMKCSTAVTVEDEQQQQEPTEPTQEEQHNNLITALHSYYGPQIAQHVAFLHHFNTQFAVPTVTGTCLFIVTARSSSKSSMWTSIFHVFLALWSSHH